MTDEIKPVRCGCGGEAITQKAYNGGWYVFCENCKMCTGFTNTEAEAITAWNRAMGERVAKVRDKKDDPMVDELHHGRCMNCGKQVRRRNNYCSRCGAKLDWSGNE